MTGKPLSVCACIEQLTNDEQGVTVCQVTGVIKIHTIITNPQTEKGSL